MESLEELPWGLGALEEQQLDLGADQAMVESKRTKEYAEAEGPSWGPDKRAEAKRVEAKRAETPAFRFRMFPNFPYFRVNGWNGREKRRFFSDMNYVPMLGKRQRGPNDDSDAAATLG